MTFTFKYRKIYKMHYNEMRERERKISIKQATCYDC